MNNKDFITRKNFIRQSALPGFGTLAFPGSPTNLRLAQYKMRLQLFTVRELLAKDVAGTIKKIAYIGYTNCETYGYDPGKENYYGLKASAFKRLLAENDMITTSGHYDFTNFFR